MPPMVLSQGFLCHDCGRNIHPKQQMIARFPAPASQSMIPEAHEPFDIDQGTDKAFLIGTSFIVIFLFLL